MSIIHELITPEGAFRFERIGPEPRDGAAGIHLVTFESGGQSWCFGVFYASRNLKPENLIGWQQSLRRGAREAAAAENSDRFLAEMLAYIRSLPIGSRSDYLDPELGDGLEEYRDEAIDDVRRALVSALRESDPFRAGVTFEKATPYLQADVGLVRVMETIIPAFEGAVGPEHLAAAASSMEKEARRARGDGDFRARQIDLWRRRTGSSGGNAVDGRMR